MLLCRFQKLPRVPTKSSFEGGPAELCDDLATTSYGFEFVFCAAQAGVWQYAESCCSLADTSLANIAISYEERPNLVGIYIESSSFEKVRQTLALHFIKDDNC